MPTIQAWQADHFIVALSLASVRRCTDGFVMVGLLIAWSGWRVYCTEMTNSNDRGGNERFYLEDLHPGQRFISGSHEVDGEQILDPHYPRSNNQYIRIKTALEWRIADDATVRSRFSFRRGQHAA